MEKSLYDNNHYASMFRDGNIWGGKTLLNSLHWSIKRFANNVLVVDDYDLSRDRTKEAFYCFKVKGMLKKTLAGVFNALKIDLDDIVIFKDGERLDLSTAPEIQENYFYNPLGSDEDPERMIKICYYAITNKMWHSANYYMEERGLDPLNFFKGGVR